MKLYGFPGSPNTWKVRALVRHLDLEVEDVLVDLGKGEQQSPEHLKLNPSGRTPTLVDGDFVLWESTAIMQYLADRKPNTLWPDDPRTRADITRWQSWGLAHWGGAACGPLLFERVVKAFFDMGPPDEAAVATATENFHRDAALLDRQLSAQRHLIGDEVTLADFSIVAPLVHGARGGLPVADYPNVQAWSARMFAMPAWRETTPEGMAAAA